jgi:hypothetical protein
VSAHEKLEILRRFCGGNCLAGQGTCFGDSPSLYSSESDHDIRMATPVAAETEDRVKATKIIRG